MKQREQALVLLQKARDDEVLVEEVLSVQRISDDTIGFHCQQAVEKLLKAVLSMHAVRYRKTHDLRELMDLLADAGCALPPDLRDLDTLNPYASMLRYELKPPDSAFDRRKALEMVRRLRQWVEPQIAD